MSSINVTINKYNRTVQMFNVELYIADDLDDTKTVIFYWYFLTDEYVCKCSHCQLDAI